MGKDYYTLTKTRLMGRRQCPKKLWLLANKPEAADWTGAQAVFDAGDEVGMIARQLYGPGPVIDIRNSVRHAVAETLACMERGEARIYEAAFIHEGVLVLADVLERVGDEPPWRYRVVEVKSSTEMKEVHIEDAAIQTWVIEQTGTVLASTHVAHIDNSFVYRGGGEYRGLLAEAVPDAASLTSVKELAPRWITAANETLKDSEPALPMGKHCRTPYDCPFQDYCTPKPLPEYPLGCLPRAPKLIEELSAAGYRDLRDVPAERLNSEKHLRIWRATKTGTTFLDPQVVAQLRALAYPRYYLDFETIAFAVPRWEGTRPFQQLRFQWSVHRQDADGSLHHVEFLDIEGSSPMRICIERLIEALGEEGPIVVYSHFESRTLKEMAAFMPDLGDRLLSAKARLFDLLPLLREHYYDPAMKGSWSIKYVLPTVAPELSYTQMAVKNGGEAQAAYLEMIADGTSAERREQLRRGLLEYCGQDTYAMVRIVANLCAG